MVIIENIKKLQDECLEAFVWRIGQMKDSGTLNLDWDGIADIVNREFYDEDTQYKEATFRKPYQHAKKYFEAGVFKQYSSNDEYMKELQLQKQEIRKEKQKLTDERTELNRMLRQQARKESFADMVKTIICENVEPLELNSMPLFSNTDNDLIVHLTDLHTGIEIENWHNRFDEAVLRSRVEKYVGRVIEIATRHHSQDCYLIVGEILSGLIHENLRLQNNMDLMEQFKYASELITWVLCQLSSHFSNVYMYTTPGNHSRVVAKKEASLAGENFDVLLPFYLKARLQNVNNVHVMDNTIDQEVAMFSVRGKKVFAAHGHQDSPANVVQNVAMMYGFKPDLVYLGHRHLNGLTTVYDSKVICSGCMSGTDQYAVSLRKTNKPEQTISVVDHNGLVCLYDIQLD